MTAFERTGWRDQAISERHRLWGSACPAVDLDFVLLEFNWSQPAAIVEYKDRHAQKPNLLHPSYVSMANLADLYSPRPLPFVVATYCPNDWWFRVLPANGAAQKLLGKCEVPMTEYEFVDLLYGWRNKTLKMYDKKLLADLGRVMPQDEAA